jgi:DNA recombination protein RmuC
MENILLIILGLVIGGIVVYFVFSRKKEEKNEDSPALLMLQQQMADLTREVNKNLIEVAREQTKTNEATRQFITIADKLGDLEKTLKHQKQRGNWGEASLELILSNTLAPGQFKMQYEFKNKEVVDAVIITKEGIIPLDAKFSLDNYNHVLHAIDDR